MTTFPRAPRLVKGGLVLLDAASGAVQRVIVLQYNPDTLTRTLQVQATGADGGDRSEALRLRGVPVETLRLDAELDAADQLEFPDQHPDVAALGLHPQLAALETVLYPSAAQLLANHALAQAGTLEIVPVEAPLTLFVWSRNRVVPVRVTELSVTEEAFDPRLNPIRAKVTLGLRVLSVDDLGFGHRGGGVFMSYLQAKEQLAAKGPGGVLNTLGIQSVP